MLKQLTVILVALSAQSAFAAQLGLAGCGLGHMIFPKDNQIFAATTNGTFYNQTFGITTGTLDCGGGWKTTQMTMFVESNRVALSDEAARGQGETVASLAELLGCQNPRMLGDSLKANYQQIFNDRENSIAITRSIQKTIESSPKLAETCQPLS